MLSSRTDRAGRRAAALVGAAALAVGTLTASGRGRVLDRSWFRWLNRDRGPAVDRAFSAITELGSIWASAGAALTLAGFGRRREALDAFGAAGTMWLVGQVVKKAVLRPRPYSELRDIRLLTHRPRGTSWPSSHPAVLLAFLTVASRDLDLSSAAKAGGAALAGAVGASRVYLGVHYPADVGGGLLLGRAVADAWTVALSPRILGTVPAMAVPH